MRDKRAWPSLSAAPRREAAPRAALGAVSRRSPAKFVTARVPKYINGIYHFGTDPVSEAPPSRRGEEHCCQTKIACGFTSASSTRVPRDVGTTRVPQSRPRGAEGKTLSHSWLPDGLNAHRMEVDTAVCHFTHPVETHSSQSGPSQMSRVAPGWVAFSKPMTGESRRHATRLWRTPSESGTVRRAAGRGPGEVKAPVKEGGQTASSESPARVTSDPEDARGRQSGRLAASCVARGADNGRFDQRWSLQGASLSKRPVLLLSGRLHKTDAEENCYYVSTATPRRERRPGSAHMARLSGGSNGSFFSR